QNVVLSIDGVKNCAIVIDSDRNNEKRLVAYIVSDTNGFNKSEVMKRLSRRLPDYMIPNIWMTVDELPLNANGKVDKKRLPKADATGRANGEFVAPRTKSQILLASIWQTSLKLDKVGIRDNFFELGGHSLTAVKVMLNIEKET